MSFSRKLHYHKFIYKSLDVLISELRDRGCCVISKTNFSFNSRKTFARIFVAQYSVLCMFRICFECFPHKFKIKEIYVAYIENCKSLFTFKLIWDTSYNFLCQALPGIVCER